MSEWGASIDDINRNINNFLSLEQNIFEGGSNSGQAIIKYTIKNTRTAVELPRIVYEDVELIVGTLSNKQVKRIGKLECGQLSEFEYSCRYCDIPFVEHELKGRVSPEELFRFEVNPIIPKRNSTLSIQSYLTVLKELDIHKWLRNIPGTVLVVGPDTTLSQLNSEEKRLSDIITEIRNASEVLDRFVSLLEMPLGSRFREQLLNHRNQVKGYLAQVDRAVIDLLDTYRRRERASVTQSRLDHMVSSLTPLAENLDKETDKLRDLK